jgi:hypothetical protein
MIINAGLNTSDIDNAIEQIEKFKLDLMQKLETFVSELAQIGIEIIQDNVKVEYDGEVRNFGSSVFFQKEVIGSEGGAVCLLIAEGQPYQKDWTTGSAMVNPLLMAEFGSGVYAIGAAQGSFPNQKHAKNPPWFWRDMYGKAHMSFGNEPTRPMLKAKQEMEQQIQDVAQRVFA